MSPAAIDHIALNFDSSSTLVLSLIMAVLLFGVGLETRVSELRAALRMPRGIVVGIAAQMLLMPALTFALISWLHPLPSIALGMLLVSCAPPGMVSNVLTARAGGNIALSVSITAVANVLTIFLLPLNLAFWAGLRPDTAAQLRAIAIEPLSMVGHIFLTLGLPFALGLLVVEKAPVWAQRLLKVLKPFSLFCLLVFVVASVASNWSLMVDYGHVVAIVVLSQEAIALSSGYGLAAACGLPEYDRRAVTYEVAIRNSAFILSMIFTFFGGLGGMALVAGFWGCIDLATGLALAAWWSRAQVRPATA